MTRLSLSTLIVVGVATVLPAFPAEIPNKSSRDLRRGSQIELPSGELSLRRIVEEIEKQSGNRLRFRKDLGVVDEALLETVLRLENPRDSFWNLHAALIEATGYSQESLFGHDLWLSKPRSDERAFVAVGPTVTEGLFRVTPVIQNVKGIVPGQLMLEVLAEPFTAGGIIEKWEATLTKPDGRTTRETMRARDAPRPADGRPLVVRIPLDGSGGSRLEFAADVTVPARWRTMTLQNPLAQFAGGGVAVGSGRISVLGAERESGFIEVSIGIAGVELEGDGEIPRIDLVGRGGRRTRAVTASGTLIGDSGEFTLLFAPGEIEVPIEKCHLVLRAKGSTQDVLVPIAAAAPRRERAGKTAVGVSEMGVEKRKDAEVLVITLQTEGAPIPAHTVVLVDRGRNEIAPDDVSQFSADEMRLFFQPDRVREPGTCRLRFAAPISLRTQKLTVTIPDLRQPGREGE